MINLIKLWFHYGIIVAGGGFEPPTFGLWAQQATTALPRYVVLRTGLEPVSSPVKGECPNQLDERSIYVIHHFKELLYKYTK